MPPFIDPGTAVVAASVIGGALGIGGSAVSAQQSAKEAKKNREFQERMSSTAYQRSAKDLEAAGLNRILALGNPATTPGGAMGVVPDYGQSITAGAQAGMGTQTGAAQIGQQKALEKKILQQTKNLTQEEQILIQKSKLWKEIAPILTQAGSDFSELTKVLNALAPQILEALQEMGASGQKAWSKFLEEWDVNIPDWNLSSGFIPNPFAE